MAADGDAGKVAKTSVHYSLGGDHCGACRFFEAPARCQKVRGSIDEDYWCRLFKRERRPTMAHGGPP